MQCPELQHQRNVMMDEFAGLEAGSARKSLSPVEISCTF